MFNKFLYDVFVVVLLSIFGVVKVGCIIELNGEIILGVRG